jgi:predicted NBD/HSP70 family sugar kinase
MVVIPSHMRHLNTQALLGCLRRLGVASRAELAKSMGMSQPTAGKIVDDLLSLGVLEEVGGDDASVRETPRIENAGGRLGRPGRMVRLDQSKPRFIGIQLGVVQTQMAALTIGGVDEDRWTLQIPTPNNLAAWIRGLRAAAKKLPQGDFWGVVVSVPGIVDEPAGRVLFSPNLHWTEASDLQQMIQEVWAAPVLLVQEERALALGHLSAHPEGRDFLLVDFGYGVGGAVVVDGRLYANPLPISGELGHTPIKGNLRACGCGAVGCVETLISRRGLLESFGAHQGNAEISWPALAQSIEKEGIAPWLAEALDAAGTVIAGALNVLGLRKVVLTGSLGELPPPVFDHLSAAILSGAMWARFGEMECQEAPRRRTAGLVGMAIDRLVIPMTAREGSA